MIKNGSLPIAGQGATFLFSCFIPAAAKIGSGCVASLNRRQPAFRRALACFRWLIAVSRFFLAALLSLRHDPLSGLRKLLDISVVFYAFALLS